MAFSSGYRSLLGEAGMWVVVAGLGAVMIANYEDLKSSVLGSLASADQTERSASQTADDETGERTSTAGASVELKASRNGHFVTEARINGRPVEVMVDTGASMVALSWEDAERAGIYVKPQDFTGRVRTANGIAKVAPVRLSSVSIGDVRVRDVNAVVSERGAMGSTLLGMTFLGRLHKVEMSKGRLLLEH